jgi:hypothetical protein
MRTKRRTSRSDQTELPFENPPEQGTGWAKRSRSRLAESNPGPTHDERVQWTTVADGWCRLTLGYSCQSVAGDGRCWTVGGTVGAHGSGVEASDVKQTDVVCIRAIEKGKASPLDRV